MGPPGDRVWYAHGPNGYLSASAWTNNALFWIRRENDDRWISLPGYSHDEIVELIKDFCDAGV